MILFTEIIIHSAGVFNRFYTGFNHSLLLHYAQFLSPLVVKKRVSKGSATPPSRLSVAKFFVTSYT